jgi:hypothetical protein
MPALSGRSRLAAVAAVAGGALLLLGAFLPWLTFYMGLHPLRGVIGLNGRLLAAGGALCLTLGVVHWLRPRLAVQRAVALLGWGLGGFVLWLMLQQFILLRELRRTPMMFPRLGPGLFVALGGALVIVLLPRLVRRSEPRLAS